MLIVPSQKRQTMADHEPYANTVRGREPILHKTLCSFGRCPCYEEGYKLGLRHGRQDTVGHVQRWVEEQRALQIDGEACGQPVVGNDGPESSREIS